MKRLIVLVLVVALACVAFAADAQKPVDDASALPAGVTAVGSPIVVTKPEVNVGMDDADAPWIETMKFRYHHLMALAGLQMASEAELAELSSISLQMNWPAFIAEPRDEGGNLDQGSGDTLVNCASATVIPPLALGGSYTDTGVFDGDNDCSVISASPNNEVFYTLTPTVTGNYQFRVNRTGATAAAPAIRVMSGGCCLGAVNVAFSSSTVAAECGEVASRVTWLRATLTAGTQYWIHVGTSAATANTEAYQFNVYLVGCPPNESAVDHSTCATAQAISVGDSLIGDSAFTTAPATADWYMFTLTQVDSVRIFVGGRELGHCISGLYPSSTSAPLGAVDGRFTLWDGACTTRLDSVDDEGCSFDAVDAYCLNPGTYYIRVFNYGVNDYVLKTTSLGPCTTNPVDCATLAPCGSPAEVEPNNVCADVANILSLQCGTTYYGVLCPGTERDYWYVPATTGSQQVTVTLSDGANCNTFPPTVLGVRLGGVGAACATPSGSFFGGFIFGGGCLPWPGGWIVVDRAAASGQSKYSLTVTCADVPFVCPCPTVATPNTAQACVSCLGEFPEPGTLPGSVSFFQTVIPQYQITDIDVCVAITHTFDGDVWLYLVSPWADTVKLVADRGSSGDNFYTTTFDDEASTLISAGVAPYNGSFVPEESLADLDGFDASGTWELICKDDANGDSGYVHCWCLNITYDVILNVELASFSAVAGDGSVTLNWATASEADNDHFVVERNGVHAANVTATNSSTGSNYTWTDNSVTNGTAYEYSLYAVDVNGARELLGSVEATPEGNAVVTEYALHQNYPNPFNPTTNISFDLVEAGQVTISVFNVMGQKVAELVNGQMNAGRHVVSFDAAGLSSGLYLYKMEANGFSAQNKMLLLK